MNIGNISIDKTAALAPMAGVADRAFREICIKHGAAYVIGEMCSAKGLIYDSRKSKELLMTYPDEQPCAVQLFGHEPDVMARAVNITQEFNPIIIDINMGCPAPKIAGAGSGCALMKDIDLAEKIIRAAVKESSVPVTVKFRKGWDENSINAVPFAQMAESAGASAIAIHGRTKAQMYAPPVDKDIIHAVVDSVNIPVIGNGGITIPEEALEMYSYTGCDLVMVGQGALGRPWVFNQIRKYLEDGIILPDPSLEERMEILREHILLAVKYKGERIAMREARSHASWYMYGFYGAAALRRQAGQMETVSDLDKLIHDVITSSELTPVE